MSWQNADGDDVARGHDDEESAGPVEGATIPRSGGPTGSSASQDTALIDEGEFVEEIRTGRRRWVGSMASCLIVLLVIGGLGAAGTYAVLTGAEALKSRFAGPEDFVVGSEGDEVLFEVRRGDSAADIARQLKADGIVASVDAFTDAAASEEASRGIQVGFYTLRTQMKASSALEVLIDSGNLLQTLVTVPEGLRVPDTLATLAKQTKIPLKRFTRAARKPQAIGLPGYAQGNPEGYLFPATYPIPPNATATSILAAMVDRWRQAAEEAELTQAADQLGYSPAQLMIVASLVESEASRPEDRGKVARVIYNRLKGNATNGLLQIDATVNYAIGRDLGLGLTTEDLATDSPYNTYVNPGLPPGPIEAPGEAAIAAATNPTEGPWVYYVTVNLDTGETRFTESYDQFLIWKNRDLAQFCDASDRC